MAITKDQTLSTGVFYPTSDKKTIFFCQIQNQKKFFQDLIIFLIVIGLFSFFLLEWFSLIILLVSWPFLVVYLLPRNYKLIQIDKHVIIYGVGSIISLLKNQKIIDLKKTQYKEVQHLKFEQWEQKKRKGIDKFGRLEILFRDDSLFHILLTSSDTSRLIHTLEKHNFQIKTQKLKSKQEFRIIFPSSPMYGSGS